MPSVPTPKIWRKTERNKPSAIAVCGLALRYGSCETHDEFYESLMKGEFNSSGITEKRLDSSDKDLHYLRKRSKFSDTFVNDRYATIDSSKKEHRSEHELLLKLTQEALNDYAVKKATLHKETESGFDASKLEGKKVGVVAGNLNFPRDNLQGEFTNLYQKHLEEKISSFGGSGIFREDLPNLWSQRPEATEDYLNSPNNNYFHENLDPASYVAHKLNLKSSGSKSVHYSIDAACASSLYILRLAQEHLLNGDCDIMLAGAATLPDPFFILSGFSAFQALPVPGPINNSVPWRLGSSGLTPGEGGAIVVMKRLEDAVKDGDYIYGVMVETGINNSGRGLPLKPIMPSELSCLLETYDLVSKSEKNLLVDYVECHATGTEQGDQVELDAMLQCYEDELKQKMPLFGSSKGNFGHTLVAAGFAGVSKLLLSMQRETIPPTPGITTENKMHGNVVFKPQSWPYLNPADSGFKIKCGAVSAFGFGGTNAHSVFINFPNEELQLRRSLKLYKSLSSKVILNDNKKEKISIVGMGCHFGSLDSLEKFEDAIYHHKNIMKPISKDTKRWRFLRKDDGFVKALGFDPNKDIFAGCIEKFNIDFSKIRTPMLKQDLLMPQHFIALKTIDDAIEDYEQKTKLKVKGSRTGVFVGLSTDLEVYRHKARVILKERLKDVLDKSEASQDEVLRRLMDYVHEQGNSTSYTSYIGNILATRVSAKYNFTGPAFSVTEGDNSAIRCLDVAKLLIDVGCIDNAIICGVELRCSAEGVYQIAKLSKLRQSEIAANPFESDFLTRGISLGEGAGALVLTRESTEVPSYSTLELLSFGGSVDATPLDSFPVELVEMNGEQLGTQVKSFSQLKRNPFSFRTMALTSHETVTGSLGISGTMAGLIKTSLCLYNRYIPQSLANGKSFEIDENLQIVDEALNKKFWIPHYSRSWVKNDAFDKTNTSTNRYAAMSLISRSGSHCLAVLKDTGSYEKRNLYASAVGKDENPQLLKFAANSPEGIVQQLERLKSADDNTLVEEFRAALARSLQNDNSKDEVSLFLVCRISEFRDELTKASVSIPKCIKLRRDYKSKRGSFFTATPLRDAAKIAFMYGDARSPYVGLGRDLFRIFPSAHKLCEDRTTNVWSRKANGQEVCSDDDFHTRSLANTEADFSSAVDVFEKDQVAMFRSGVFHAMLFTQVMLQVLKLRPASCFGLSLGEICMYFAFSLENSLGSEIIMNKLRSSRVWMTELAGDLLAVRQKTHKEQNNKLKLESRATDSLGLNSARLVEISKIWTGYVLLKSKDEIAQGIQELNLNEDLKIMIVNSTKSCLVIGRPSAFDKLIDHLNINRRMCIKSEQMMLAHCDLVDQYLEDFEGIHSHNVLPEENDITFHSIAADLASKGASFGKIAGQVYKRMGDFPFLVEQAARDGANVFLELGSDNLRSLATSQILSDLKLAKEGSLISSINKKGEDSWVQLLTMLACLRSHQVSNVLNVGSLYTVDQQIPLAKKSKMIKELEINGRYQEFDSSIFKGILGKLPQRKSIVKSITIPYYKNKILLAPLDAQSSKKTRKEPKVVNGNKSNGIIPDRKKRVSFASSQKIKDSSHCQFGSAKFQEEFGVKRTIVLSGMMNAVTGVNFVATAAKNQLIAFYGSHNVPLKKVEDDLASLKHQLSAKELRFVGVNIVKTSNPLEVHREELILAAMKKNGIELLEVSGYKSLVHISKHLLRFRLQGGKIFAKVGSLPEAKIFTSKISSSELLMNKVSSITKETNTFDASVESEISLASAVIPVGSNVSLNLVPVLLSEVRTSKSKAFVGCSGGVCDGSTAYSAFSTGCDFLCTGSVNLLCSETNLPLILKRKLMKLTYSDVDAAEFGINFTFADPEGSELIHVVKKGSFGFARAKLLALHNVKIAKQSYQSLDQMKDEDLLYVKNKVFKEDVDSLVTRLLETKKTTLSQFNAYSFSTQWGLICGHWLREQFQKGELLYCNPTIGYFNSLSTVVAPLPSVVSIVDDIFKGLEKYII
eukprot:snap_masked-scaffold_13-processed-gene-11.15-mRNA-1 protein AED:1.00 eAED:1.00 QI:0/-1/0/0/-1/1/1/0/1998